MKLGTCGFILESFYKFVEKERKRELFKVGNLKITLCFPHKRLILCLQSFYDVKDLYSNIALTKNLRNLITLKGRSDFNVFV